MKPLWHWMITLKQMIQVHSTMMTTQDIRCWLVVGSGQSPEGDLMWCICHSNHGQVLSSSQTGTYEKDAKHFWVPKEPFQAWHHCWYQGKDHIYLCWNYGQLAGTISRCSQRVTTWHAHSQWKDSTDYNLCWCRPCTWSSNKRISYWYPIVCQ